MRRRGELVYVVLAALLLAINVAGATAGFPVMDDGELMTTSREAGIAAIGPTNRDRPVNGWLILQSVTVLGERPILWAATAALFWALLAFQAARLVRRLFPNEPASAGVAALLVIAPLVVQMQYTTLTFIYAACLPVALSLEALLAVLDTSGSRERRGRHLVAGACLVAAAALVSEYAIPTLAAGATLLLVLGRRRGAAALLVGGGLGHLAFRATADAAARPDTMPSAGLARLSERVGAQIAGWLGGAWQSLIGAYATAAGAVKLDASSKSTYAAVLLGALCAGGVVLARRSQPETEAGPKRILAGLVLAVFAGLLPIVVAGRDPSSGWFLSRFRLPILAFAVAATTHLLNRITAPRWCVLAPASLAFLSGWAALTHSSVVRWHQQSYDAIGKAMLPIVRASDGFTAVVVPDEVYAVGWAKMMRRWPLDDERRSWALDEGSGLGLFGPRGTCTSPSWLHVRPTLRNVGRDGPLSRVLWARRAGNGFVLEPYCGAPAP